MNDKTTEGHAVSTEEIEGMLRNLCAFALSDPEPLQRYLDLTHQQVLFDGVVAAIRRERGKALGDLAAMGVPMAKVAEMADLGTPQRVKQLMTAAGVAIPAVRKAVRKAAPVDVDPIDVTQRNVAVDAHVAPGPSPVRAGAPMLPTTIIPAGKRTLTPHERRALGLPVPIPMRRERSLAAR